MLQALENLTELYVDYQEIRSLRGLEYAMGLEVLNLFWNQGIDITPLVGLTRLQELGLYHNKITDITPLDGMWRTLCLRKVLSVCKLHGYLQRFRC